MAATVALTGAAGFVGRHLLAELGEQGGPLDVDVTNTEAVGAAIRRARPDALVHLAARSSVAESWVSPDKTWRVNVIGTVNVLRGTKAERPDARVLAVSSGEVYGRAEVPTPEDAQLAPLSPYAASKAAAEIACAQAARADGLDVVIARPFQHIGPGQNERFAVGSWVHQIARLERQGGGTLEVGDLTIERDLTDVRDVCRAYRLLIDTGVPSGVYNVASGIKVSLAQVVQGLIRLAECSISIEETPGAVRPVDVPVLCGDASKLRDVTGWRPEIPLERSLADALEEARTLVKTSNTSDQWGATAEP